jgi:hypothetical protein
MWGEIESLLLAINSVTWLSYLAASFAAVFLIRDLSFKSALIAWSVADLVNLVFTPILFSLSDVDRELARIVWYPAFSILSLFTIFFIYQVHRQTAMPVSRFSKPIVLWLLMMVALNAVRFFDRVVFETNLTAEVFKYGLLAVKVWASVAVWIYIYQMCCRSRRIA